MAINLKASTEYCVHMLVEKKETEVRKEKEIIKQNKFITMIIKI